MTGGQDVSNQFSGHTDQAQPASSVEQQLMAMMQLQSLQHQLLMQSREVPASVGSSPVKELKALRQNSDSCSLKETDQHDLSMSSDEDSCQRAIKAL